MANVLTIAERVLVGDNDHGWRFFVCRVGDRWLGLASESAAATAAKNAFRSEGLAVDASFGAIMPEVSDGFCLGLTDRDEAIRRIGAVAQDVGHCFGGIDRWYVAEDLRVDPELYRCPDCEELFCEGHDAESFEECD